MGERPDPRPSPGEALVRVKLAGICGTDLDLARGYMDFDGVPGHEFVGVVEEVAGNGDERARWEGRRVVGGINIACGSCSWCNRGLGRHCPKRTVLGILGKDGAQAEWLTLPLANLHAVPDQVTDQEAVFAEPLAAACEILDQVTVGEGTRVLVIGDGRLAQLVARVLRTRTSSTTVLGRHPEKLAHLSGLDIATTTDGPGLAADFDLVVDATGSPSGVYQAARLVKPRGTIVLKSTFLGERPLPIARLVVDEVTLVGSRCGRLESALPMLASRAVRVDDLISETLPLADAAKGYERSAARGVLKVLLAS